MLWDLKNPSQRCGLSTIGDKTLIHPLTWMSDFQIDVRNSNSILQK